MCGIAAIIGPGAERARLEAMVATQHHRGPDDAGIELLDGVPVGLGHRRLSIVDRSARGRMPMGDAEGRVWLIFNGEIYNYRELKRELGDYPFVTQTDSEVILAAYRRWGMGCLDHLVGMFAFVLWDTQRRVGYAVRDRFGVKPLYFAREADGTLLFASEIKALHAAGIARVPDERAWATYLSAGYSDVTGRTFWRDVSAVRPATVLEFDGHAVRERHWYDLADRIGDQLDEREDDVVLEELYALLTDSVRLRFRADVPVGISLSGGLDSSLLLQLVADTHDDLSALRAFHFHTGDPSYDELRWVQAMVDAVRVAASKVALCAVRLDVDEVAERAEALAAYQDEPYGGVPTVAYAKLFERARAMGVPVLLDGQGLDEQWAGYDYYAGEATGQARDHTLQVQGARSHAVRPECLAPEFREAAEPVTFVAPFGDPLRDAQYRDLAYAKLPRALRFNDRASMKSSVELREPFLDQRLVELAFRQPARRKLQGSATKWALRRLAERRLPRDVALAPKRPVQTPQREWLRGPLRDWANDHVEQIIARHGGRWLEPDAVRSQWRSFCAGECDNSFFVWQWISLSLCTR